MENRKKREAPHSTKAPWILGTMMIIVGLIMVFSRMFSIEYEDQVLFVDDSTIGIISRALLIVGGVIIILFRKKGNYFTVGLYALTLGLSRIIRSIPGLLTPYDPTIPIITDLPFYSALVFTIIGGNLFYSGYNHLTVKTRNPSNMRYTAMALLILYAIVIMYWFYLGEDVVYLILSDINMIGYMPLYAGLLVVLFSREISENNPIGRIATFMSSVTSSSYVGDSIAISEDDAKTIKDGFAGGDSWSESLVNGRTVRESCIVFHTMRGDKDVIVQRWSDSDAMYMSIANDRRDSFVGGHRMKVVGYDICDGKMVLRDEMGTCAIMTIGGDF